MNNQNTIPFLVEGITKEHDPELSYFTFLFQEECPVPQIWKFWCILCNVMFSKKIAGRNKTMRIMWGRFGNRGALGASMIYFLEDTLCE